MLDYNGHPLFDVGVATITAFADKDDPTELTETDLDKVAEYIQEQYIAQPLKSYLSVVFTNGAWCTSPTLSLENQTEQARRVLYSYKIDSDSTQKCVFTGEAAIPVSLNHKDTTPIGRVFRQHIPLLTGEGVINFHAHGNSGTPISGKALLAIQAMPLGCAKSGGRLLMVHSDNRDIMLYFAREFLRGNRMAIQMAQLADSTKLSETDYSYRTLLIQTLLPAKNMQYNAMQDEEPFSITAYHFSNSGQGPSLDMYHLPLEMIGFLRDMISPEYNHEWNALVYRAWEVEPEKKGKKKSEEVFKPRRNYLYEDLFGLPDKAAYFIRTYFLRVALRHAKTMLGDPRGHYSTKNEAALVSWKITAKFLRSVMHMEREQVEEIKKMGEAFANYVMQQNDKSFFRNFFVETRYYNFRALLLKADVSYVKQGHGLLIGFDSYITVFEDGEELGRSNWTLARDLVLIRMIERLHELGWFAKNPDALPDMSTETTVEEPNKN